VHATNGFSVTAVQTWGKITQQLFLCNAPLPRNKFTFKAKSHNAQNTHANSARTTLFAYKVVQNSMILSAMDFPRIC
jgi:hypothetical protein